MIRFQDFYKSGATTLSLEVFPPKTPLGVQHLFQELQKLKTINPAFVSVTYGAMGSTRELTRDLVLRIRDELKHVVAFHFTCVGFGRSDIEAYVTDLANHGLNLVVALRGDKPTDDTNYQAPADGFHFASELVEYLNGFGRFSMAVAGYPEKHLEALSFESDLANLKRKVDAGGEIVLTQLFFDNRHFYSYVERVRSLGVKCPIVAGIMPLQNVKQADRLIKMCGATLPDQLAGQLAKYQDDPETVFQIGIEHAIAQCQDLIDHGVAGIHFYSLNKADAVLRVVQGCRFQSH